MTIRHFFVSLATFIIATAVPATAVTKIAVLSDIHVSPGAVNGDKLAEAVAEINTTDCDIVIISGDLTYTGSDAELTNVKAILDKLSKPTFTIPGNHENNWSQSAGATYRALWGDDRFLTEIDGITIIGMNCGPFMKMGNGHVKREDLIWLSNTLDKSNGKPVISVNHYPLNSDLDVCDEYVDILSRHNVILHLNGHYHQFKHYTAANIECLTNRSLDMRNGNYGYTIIEIANDSIHQWDKQLGVKPIKINSIGNNANIAKSVNVKSNFKPYESNEYLTKVYADNASVFTQPGVDKNCIYVGNSLGYVKCIDKKSGKVKWEFKTAESLHSRPLVSDKYVIVPTTDNRLIWLNKKTGKEIFATTADGPYVADGIISCNIAYIGGYNTFSAWDINSKKQLWQISTNNYCQAAPALSGNEIAFGAWDTKVRCLDVPTGKLNWDWDNGSENVFFSPGNVVPVITENIVYTVAPDRYLTAIDRKTGNTLWRNNSHKYRESMGCSEDMSRIYAKTMDGEIVAIKAGTPNFEELWYVDAKFGYEHAPCTMLERNGIVYAGSIKGEIAAVDSATQKLLWISKIGNSEVNGWAVDADGNIFASLGEGTIWKVNFK